MAVSDSDIKRLWAKSAGHCAFPDCDTSCVPFLDQSGDTIIGEMAHVIARKETGPRGRSGSPGPDTYENLVLLCPTHHTLVDKAPADFPEALLRKWKRSHELRVEQSLSSPSFGSKERLYSYIRRILAENRTIHQRFGPESFQALANPLSEGSVLWPLRKLDAVIPNNRRIINAFEQHSDLVPENHWDTFLEFREHALAFEKNAYQRIDHDLVPRFPVRFFESVLRGHNKVASFTKRNYYVFDIERREGLGSVVTLLTDLYTVGLADVVLAETEVEGLNCIVTISNWSGYTQEAKEYTLQHQIGLFQLSEFMRALWRRDFWNYVKRDEKGNPIYPYKGRSA